MSEPITTTTTEPERPIESYTDDELAELTRVNEMMAAYRKHKAEIDKLEFALKPLRQAIQAHVEANGKYQDIYGYARMVEAFPKISYDVKALDALCKSDPALDAILSPHRSTKIVPSYLQIK